MDLRIQGRNIEITRSMKEHVTNQALLPWTGTLPAHYPRRR